MLVHGVFSSILYVLMASVAKVGREVFNHLWVTGAMRIMAADAVVLRRFVDKLIFRSFIFCYNMTCKTKLRVFGNQ